MLNIKKKIIKHMVPSKVSLSSKEYKEDFIDQKAHFLKSRTFKL